MITTNTPQRVAGKIALVTGGSSGIGLAAAKRLLAEGAYVIITGRRKEALDEAVRTIGPDSLTAICGDVSNLRDLDRVFATIRKDVGALDIVFANAGSGSLLPLGSITEQQVDDTFATNVKGVVFTVQGSLPLLRAGGSIILAHNLQGKAARRTCHGSRPRQRGPSHVLYGSVTARLRFNAQAQHTNWLQRATKRWGASSTGSSLRRYASSFPGNFAGCEIDQSNRLCKTGRRLRPRSVKV